MDDFIFKFLSGYNVNSFKNYLLLESLAIILFKSLFLLYLKEQVVSKVVLGLVLSLSLTLEDLDLLQVIDFFLGLFFCKFPR